MSDRVHMYRGQGRVSGYRSSSWREYVALGLLIMASLLNLGIGIYKLVETLK